MLVKKLPPVEFFALVSTPEQCKEAISVIKDYKEVGVDCEWANVPSEKYTPAHPPEQCEKTIELLCTVQVATPNYICFIFDTTEQKSDGTRTFSPMMFDLGLKEILTSKTITKIFHDCRGDSKVLFQSLGFVPQNIYDTQIAFAILENKRTKNYPYPVALKTLIRKFYPEFELTSKDEFHELFQKEPEFWLKRPFSNESLVYAAEDVLALIFVKTEMEKEMDDRMNLSVSSRSDSYSLLFKKNAKTVSDDGRPCYGFADWDL